MSGKTTAMKNVRKSLDYDIELAPHFREFFDMSPQERLAMYEIWTPEEFTKQAIKELTCRHNNSNDLEDTLVLTDRGSLTHLSFCLSKFMTDYHLELEESFIRANELQSIIDLEYEKVSIVLKLSLEESLSRAEGKEDWKDHYRLLIENAQIAMDFLCDYLKSKIHIVQLSAELPKESVSNLSQKIIVEYMCNK